jgi:hypothetical protein
MSEIKLRGGFEARDGTLAEAGSTVATHAHKFPHVTYLLGPALVERLEPLVENPQHDSDFRVVKSVRKPQGGYVTIDEGVWHRLTSLGNSQAARAPTLLAALIKARDFIEDKEQIAAIDAALATARIDRGLDYHCLFRSRSEDGELSDEPTGWAPGAE